jgi:hypothetical protein
MFNPLLLDEPVPVNGRLKAAELDCPASASGSIRTARCIAPTPIDPRSKELT